jgi:site-specific recombinase XerD
MPHQPSDFVNSKSENSAFETPAFTPHLKLVEPEKVIDETPFVPFLEDFDFSTPPWLLAPVDGFLDKDGVIPITALDQLGAHWITDRRNSRRRSEKTLRSYQDTLANLLWFLRARKCSQCGELELYQFLEYCRIGHTVPGGRWGNPRLTKPLSDRSVALFYVNLRAFFNWSVRNKLISASPLERIELPAYKETNVPPFTHDHLDALFMAARQSKMAHRNVGILTFLYDTGLREDEMCRLELNDINWKECTARIRHGKGNKERTVTFSQDAGTVVWNYLVHDKRRRPGNVFLSQQGCPLTTSGLYQLFERLGAAAGITDIRCSPHTMCATPMHLTPSKTARPRMKCAGSSGTRQPT